MLLIIICLSALVESSVAQLPGLEYPDYTPMPNFNVSKVTKYDHKKNTIEHSRAILSPVHGEMVRGFEIC